MKKSWCFAACMVALVAVACGGGSNTPSIDVFSPADFLSGDPGSDIPSAIRATRTPGKCRRPTRRM